MWLDNSMRRTQIFSATAVRKRFRGRNFREIRDCFVDNLKIVMPNLDSRRNTPDWIEHARVEVEWIRIVKRKESRERG